MRAPFLPGLIGLFALVLAVAVFANDGGNPDETDSLQDVVPVDKVATGEAESAGASPRRSSRLIEEITVTAQRREEGMQDVPIAISAFSAEQMDARGVRGIKDLGQYTPSLQFTDFVGYTLTYLRGIGTDTFIPSAEQSVATYIDGIYLPSAHALGQSFGALERIEVLKGPQGTLFGRNSSGGAINIVTRKPGPEFGTDVQMSYGRFNDWNNRVHANLPLTDWLSASVSGFYNERDSHYRQDNRRLPSRLPRDEERGARLKLGFYPTENIDFVLTGLVTRQRSPTAAVGVNTRPSLLGTLLLIQPEERDFVTPNDDSPFVATDINAYYGEFRWGTRWLDLKLIGGDIKVKTSDYRVDLDGSAMPIATSESPNEFQEITTLELQFLSNEDTPGANRFRWVAGLYYVDAEGGYEPVRLSVLRSVVELPTGELLSLVPEVLLDLIDFLPAPTTISPLLFGTVGTDSFSGYFQGTLSITDWFDVTLGGRYQREKRELIRSSIELQNAGGGTTPLLVYAPRDETSTAFTPRVSLDFRFVDGMLLYLSYSQGVKSGTYNVVNVTQPPDFVKPEKVTAVELGVKWDALGGDLRLNSAIFQSDVSNQQVSFVSLLEGGVVRFENAAEARIRGMELDALWTVMPNLNPGLALTANASYLDAIYTDFPNGSGYNEQTGLFSANNDFGGNRISRVPKYTWSVGFNQALDAPGGMVELSADYIYNDGFFFLAQNSEASHEPSYALLNARISYLLERWNLRITAFGDNLTDERYNASQFHIDFGRLDSQAPPRTFGLRLNWSL